MPSAADKKWNEWYRKLVEYKEEHGHSAVSAPPKPKLTNHWEYRIHRTREDEELNKLAQWASRQRSLYKSNKLSPERVQLLNDIDFYWNAADLTWDKHVQELKETYEEQVKKNGSDSHFIPGLATHKDNTNDLYKPSLMQWVDYQRKQFMLYRGENQKSQLTERRIQRLESAVPGFQWWKDEEDKARLQKNADRSHMEYIFRMTQHYLPHFQIMANIEAAKKEHEETGNPTMAKYRGCIIAVDKSDYGTFRLVSPSELGEVCRKAKANGEESVSLCPVAFGVPQEED